jgi:hypothetical protein
LAKTLIYCSGAGRPWVRFWFPVHERIYVPMHGVRRWKVRGAVLIPGERSSVLWLNLDLEMIYADFSDLQAWPSPGHRLPGNSTNLGGQFASPPAGVQIGADRLEVFGLGTDYALRHKSYDGRPGGAGWPAEWEILGSDLTSTPTIASTSEDRLDVFALGPDQGMLHRERTGTTWSAWEELGGCFTSTPVVLTSGRDTFDIFARGPDYLIYRGQLTAAGFSGWAALGGGLLREPIAASAPAAVRVHDEVYVFVVAADGAIWLTRFDGTVWRPWSSLGGSFVSDPVAIALFAEVDATGGRSRIDVFGVHSGHHAMMHNWLEFSPGGRTWHGWAADSDAGADGLPNGACTCAPSISAPHAAATPKEMPPVDFELVQPNEDGIIHQLTFTNGQWWRHDVGPQYGLPSTYVFNLNYLTAISVRSQFHDSNQVSETLLLGGRPPQSRVYVLPDSMSNGTVKQFVYNMIFGPDTVELCEPVMYSWTVLNSENSALAGPLEALLEQVTQAAVGESLLSGGFIGSVLGGMAGYGLSLAFSGCDGIVDVGETSYPNGRALQKAVLESPGHLLRGTVRYKGEDPGGECGAPIYTMEWAIKLVQHPVGNPDMFG